MIANTSFTEIWINTLKKTNPKANINPPLFEKMAYALLLAESLKTNGLDFIFKGGTSLILLLDKPQRFSIDIDIITQANPEIIEAVLAKVCTDSRFTHFELDKKRSYLEGIPMAQGVQKTHALVSLSKGATYYFARLCRARICPLSKNHKNRLEIQHFNAGFDRKLLPRKASKQRELVCRFKSTPSV